MIREGGVEDVTDKIRERKHSRYLRIDAQRIKEIIELGIEESEEHRANRFEAAAPFMFREYTDIYNRARKGNLDFDILGKFIDVLEKIELGELGQHDGAHVIGKLLKKIYVDSALRQADKLDTNAKKEIKIREKVKDISYAAFKSEKGKYV
tara:strand:+ start:300 stop:752 length:453 start_codon:yes stop_codon:yes gene_type:complete